MRTDTGGAANWAGRAHLPDVAVSASSRSVRPRSEEVEMMLKDKVAVVYGAGGEIGGAVSRAFAREGARVFLTGPRVHAVEAVAKEIVASGGAAEASELDALDEQGVAAHLRSVIHEASRTE